MEIKPTTGPAIKNPAAPASGVKTPYALEPTAAASPGDSVTLDAVKVPTSAAPDEPKSSLSTGSRFLGATLLGLAAFTGVTATASPAAAATFQTVVGHTAGTQFERVQGGGGGFHGGGGGGGFHPAPSGGGGFHQAPSGGGGFHPAPPAPRPVQQQPTQQWQQPVQTRPQPTYQRPAGGGFQQTFPQGGQTSRPVQHSGPPQVMQAGGQTYRVPDGGWVTHVQQNHPNLQTVHFDDGANRDQMRNRIVGANDFYGQHLGSSWHNNPWGFYYGDSFFLGYSIGSLDAYDWANSPPIEVVSPVTQEPIGELPAPTDDSSMDMTSQIQLNTLNVMANPQQDPNNQDPSAGLYQATSGFDPSNPGDQLSGNDAFSILQQGGSVYFHPPNGAFEPINGLGDLDPYLYAQEQRQDAPDQSNVDTSQDSTQGTYYQQTGQ